MMSSSLVVVHKLDVVGIRVPPAKTDPILVVNPDAKLTGPIPAQFLEMVASHAGKILE
jgi:hypothetical protein